MICPFCNQYHEAKIIHGQEFYICPECPPETMHMIPSGQVFGNSLPDLITERAIEEQRRLGQVLKYIVHFWDKDESGRLLDEVHKEQYEFTQSVYLAIDWPTELPLNFRM